MFYQRRTFDRITNAVLLLHATMTYSNVHHGMGLDAITSLFLTTCDFAVFFSIYGVIMDTLTGEPMKIFETFLDLLFKKRKARLVKVPVATAIPVQGLALPAPAIQLIDIQEIDVQEPALESVVIEEIKEEVKEEVYVEPEIITESEAIEVQEEIPEQVSDSLSPSGK